jgi:DNA-binding IclR family transcriptional regulator
VLLAFAPRATARRLYDAHAEEVAQRGLGAGWPEFRAHLSLWRKKGFYHSRGEAERGVAGLAVPLLDQSGVAVAALTLVGALSRLTVEQEPVLVAHLKQAADEIESRLA